MSMPLFNLQGAPVSAEELFKSFHIHGLMSDFNRAVSILFLRRWAQQNQVSPTDEKLQQAADRFREARHLYTPEETMTWMAARALTEDNFEQLITDQLIEQAYLQAIPETQVVAHFKQTSNSYRPLHLKRIACSDEGLALELLILMEEQALSFEEAAAGYGSTLEERELRGTDTEHYRTDPPGWLPVSAFDMASNSLLGPLQTPRGWELMLVMGLGSARLDNHTQTRVREALLQQAIVSGFSWSSALDKLPIALG